MFKGVVLFEKEECNLHLVSAAKKVIQNNGIIDVATCFPQVMFFDVDKVQKYFKNKKFNLNGWVYKECETRNETIRVFCISEKGNTSGTLTEEEVWQTMKVYLFGL